MHDPQAARVSSLALERLRKRCEADLVDSGLCIAVADAFEINHRRSVVAVTHPLLLGTNVDSLVVGSKRSDSISQICWNPFSKSSFGVDWRYK